MTSGLSPNPTSQTHAALQRENAELKIRLQRAEEALSALQPDGQGVSARQLLDEARRSRRVLLSLLEDQKLAETELRERERLLKQVMQAAPDGMLLLNQERRVVLANPAAEAHLALLTDNASAKLPLTRLDGRTLDELLQAPPNALWHEVESGETVFEIVTTPISKATPADGWVMVIRDVTQEREIRHSVQQHERLAAVGQLAAGIAHDFNNILTVIALYAELMGKMPDLPEPAEKRLAVILEQALLASELVQQILDFGRSAALARARLDLLPFLKELVKLFQRTLPESIEIRLTHDGESFVVHADPTRVQQMIMNLALNARDAMPEGGHLTLAVRHLTFAQPDPGLPPGLEPGDWVRMAVSDTGSGIPADVLPHIFEPFFTTKPRGQGTGLGLAQVYGIVKQHGGEMDVETEVGRGTTFVIYLPAEAEPPTAERPAQKAGIPRGQGELILLVEDNRMTREVLGETLELLDYRVIAAQDGVEAMAVYEQHIDDVRLVLSDMVMPRMGGKELLAELRKRNPAVRFIMISGHPLDDIAKNVHVEGLHKWLNKVVSIEELAQSIAEALALP